MIEFKIQYFNSYNLQHSTEIIFIPIARLVGAKQDDMLNLIKEKMKYKSMDCVISCVKGHEAVEPFVPYLLKKTVEKNNRLF